MFIFIPFIFEGIFLVIFTSIIVSAVKRMKGKVNLKSQNKDNSTFQNTISNANDPNSFGNSVSEMSTDTFCDYCGSKFSKVKKKCPSCGAKNDQK